MWYNTQMKAKPPRYQSSRVRNKYQMSNSTKVNPRERLMNTQKRQKLRDLLIERFSNKYNLGNNKQLIEGEITKFLQQEKLNDVDLQRLDKRIQKIISDNISQKNLKSSLTKELNYNIQPENEQNQNQNVPSNFQEEESIYPANYKPPVESNINNTLKQSNKANVRSGSYQNKSRPLSSQTYIRNDKIDLNKNKNKTKYKSPEEELAALVIIMN